jgi:hypothetical protein
MRYRFTGAVVAIAVAAVALTMMPTKVQTQGQQRPERIAGRPNLNGIWQALSTAHWNLEDHSAEAPSSGSWARLARFRPARA